MPSKVFFSFWLSRSPSESLVESTVPPPHPRIRVHVRVCVCFSECNDRLVSLSLSLPSSSFPSSLTLCPTTFYGTQEHSRQQHRETTKLPSSNTHTHTHTHHTPHTQWSSLCWWFLIEFPIFGKRHNTIPLFSLKKKRTKRNKTKALPHRLDQFYSCYFVSLKPDTDLFLSFFPVHGRERRENAESKHTHTHTSSSSIVNLFPKLGLENTDTIKRARTHPHNDQRRPHFSLNASSNRFTASSLSFLLCVCVCVKGKCFLFTCVYFRVCVGVCVCVSGWVGGCAVFGGVFFYVNVEDRARILFF